jgi:hypothetical protein
VRLMCGALHCMCMALQCVAVHFIASWLPRLVLLWQQSALAYTQWGRLMVAVCAWPLCWAAVSGTSRSLLQRSAFCAARLDASQVWLGLCCILPLRCAVFLVWCEVWPWQVLFSEA